MLAWMSRNANSSAPCSSYRRAASTGSPASRRSTKLPPLTTRPLAGELAGGLDVDAGQHAVAADVGVDDRFDAVILELLGQIENVVTAHLGPAVGRNLAFARVQADDDVSRERVAGVVQESGILHRRGPDDHVGNAVVEIALDGVEVADSAAKLHGDLFADHADDLADRELVLGLPRERAVEVDDVQTLCAQLKPVLRHRRRLLRAYGRRLHLALLQAHAMT